MPVIRHEIPILEFDSDARAVLNPDHEGLDLHLPERCVFAFLGDVIDRYARASGAQRASRFVSATRDYPVYVVRHGGEDIALCQAPVGAAAAAQLLDWLIAYGAKKIVSAGSCGALQKFPEGLFLVPGRALRDEGTSYHYAPPSRFIEVDASARGAIRAALADHGLKYREVTTWSTDGFFRETPAKVAYRREEGCSVVEMECSALAACAKLRGACWGMILYTADSLADVQAYDERSWGGDAREYALKLCLDAVLKM